MRIEDYQELQERTALTTIGAIQNRFCNPTTTRLLHAQVGIASEAGELSDALKKHLYYGLDLDTENVREELGDILWYISEACNACGFEMKEIMHENIEKLKIRYPNKFRKEQAIERRDKQ